MYMQVGLYFFVFTGLYLYVLFFVFMYIVYRYVYMLSHTPIHIRVWYGDRAAT